MITGFHTIVYSDDAETTRAPFREVLGWPALDAAGRWLIFKTPPSELGVHPTSEDSTEATTTVPSHQASLMCDDIDATLAELRNKGVDVWTTRSVIRASDSWHRSAFPARGG